MLVDFEIGYTPKNMEKIVHFLTVRGFTKKQIAEQIGVGYRTFYNWTLDPRSSDFRQMPIKEWTNLIHFFGLQNIEESEIYYRYITKKLDELLDIVGDDETHPLSDLLSFYGTLVSKYEEKHHPYIV